MDVHRSTRELADVDQPNRDSAAYKTTLSQRVKYGPRTIVVQADALLDESLALVRGSRTWKLISPNPPDWTRTTTTRRRGGKWIWVDVVSGEPGAPDRQKTSRRLAVAGKIYDPFASSLLLARMVDLKKQGTYRLRAINWKPASSEVV